MTETGNGTVGKALDVLDLIAAQGQPVRFSEIQRLSPLPKATLHRLLQTLVNNRMVQQDPANGSYSLGTRLMRMAHAAWRHASLAPVARPLLDALSRECGRPVHLAQLDHGHVLYVDRRDAADPDAAFSDAGKIAPAYCTGVGKAMLAFLSPAEQDHVLSMQTYQRFTPATLASETLLRQSLARIKERGFAVDREEYQLGTLSVAAPVLSSDARVLGAVGITENGTQNDIAVLDAWIPQLRRCADAIADEASQWAFPVETTTDNRQGREIWQASS